MNTKHKVIQDYQFVTSEKKIVVLKANSILENYTYTAKGSNNSIKIEKEIIENNAAFFKIVDWKEELHSFIKSNKIPQPAIISKKLAPFIEEMFISNQVKVEIKPDLFEKINEDEFKFKESQLEAKAKRLENLEKQLLEEQQKNSDKELELLKRERNFSEKNKTLESNLSNENLLERELEDLQKKYLDLFNREKELFEKETKFEKLSLIEKNIQSEKNELNEKLIELGRRQKVLEEKENQSNVNFTNLEDIALREFNLESKERRIEIKENQLKIDLDDFKKREFELEQTEKILLVKEEQLNKKEEMLNSEEINLLDLSNKLDERQNFIDNIQNNLQNYVSVDALEKSLDIFKQNYLSEPSFSSIYIPRFREIINFSRNL